MMIASATTAPRQPNRVTSAEVPGRNAVLASPPVTVTVAIARRRPSGSAKARPTIAKTGSYRIEAMHRPSAAQTM